MQHRYRLPFANGQFDVVIFTEVLEYLRGIPDVALCKLHRVIKKDGSLLLSTPNVGRLTNIEKFIKGQNILPKVNENFFQINGSVGHFREYTISEVKELLKRVGFEPKHVSLFSRYRIGLARFRSIPYFIPKWREFIMVEALKKAHN